MNFLDLMSRLPLIIQQDFLVRNLLVIKQTDASVIADLMLGGTGENVSDVINELQLSAVQEAMNQMMGNAATSMSTVFQKRVDISPPTLRFTKYSGRTRN